jgi:hypothetical protein
MCKYADVLRVCSEQKKPSRKQDGFYILIKTTGYNFPAIASLTKSLATICSLNE